MRINSASSWLCSLCSVSRTSNVSTTPGRKEPKDSARHSAKSKRNGLKPCCTYRKVLNGKPEMQALSIPFKCLCPHGRKSNMIAQLSSLASIPEPTFKPSPRCFVSRCCMLSLSVSLSLSLSDIPYFSQSIGSCEAASRARVMLGGFPFLSQQ